MEIRPANIHCSESRVYDRKFKNIKRHAFHSFDIVLVFKRCTMLEYNVTMIKCISILILTKYMIYDGELLQHD